ncbi:MAG: homoserine kinase [Balneolaceae bacterium]
MDSIKKNTAFAPATVANVACGFDVLGFAIHGLGDEVTATLTHTHKVEIASITGDDGRLPLETEKNTAGKAVMALLKALGKENTVGIQLDIKKNMPLGSGLGSSAASSVAAVVAVNHLLDSPFTTSELLPFTVEGEIAASGTPHADNVAAALYGGFVLVKTHHPPDVIPLPTPAKLYCTLIHPDIEIETKSSRLILKKDVPLAKAVTQWGNVGALVAALFMDDYELIGRSLHDEIIEPVRSVLIPGFTEMKQAAMKAGALGCSISGSGPSLFALSTSKKTAQEVGTKMGAVLKSIGLDYNMYLSKINTEGASIRKSEL